ncbi:LysM peptidoglycan-binding domain-containing protein [Bacillus kwashiorkori]|uniref:LysM peptidoglycan-binding domain-containing protein n=1 Tax=Bacillus kwashiorkori TaxID=1522318 RepID=UPI0007823177|nr:LysM peptidoglycan-binding domain-containing protein [Bacillus kwashiorkori]
MAKPSSLKFSLEEAVWFRKGEEIADLVSLSLEPNVTIQELDHYISIRGSLEMNGEYKKVAEQVDDDHGFAFSGQKYVNVEESREVGIYEFTYQFPVDITIPKTRIKSVEELNILIDSFDYNIPERSCLKLSTDISIHGVYEEDYSFDDWEDENDNERLNTMFQPVEKETSSLETETPVIDLNESVLHPLDNFEEETDEEKTFTVEARKQFEKPHQEAADHHVPIQVFYQEDETEDKGDIESAASNDSKNIWLISNSPLKKAEFVEREEEESSSSSSSSEVNNSEAMKEINIPDAIGQELESVKSVVREETPSVMENLDIPQLEQNDETNELRAAEQEKVVKEVAEVRNSNESNENDTADEISENTPALQRKEQERADVVELADVRSEKNIKYQAQEKSEESSDASISLTKFFARKEEERPAKMRMYIVQGEDTLSVIAERYNVNPAQILRMNQLEPNQDVYEGQVLYIPVKREKAATNAD